MATTHGYSARLIYIAVFWSSFAYLRLYAMQLTRFLLVTNGGADLNVNSIV